MAMPWKEAIRFQLSAIRFGEGNGRRKRQFDFSCLQFDLEKAMAGGNHGEEAHHGDGAMQDRRRLNSAAALKRNDAGGNHVMVEKRMQEETVALRGEQFGPRPQLMAH
ncbi:hypothetical protein GUJ93_ZPchr0006g43599 [Zizania palustris]|uniref:Uncharacterized protein n=1 Tax=Zizania palustris TaxID=103762 RepID=A0A8J5TF34_ZIZPA|nr:hypothetical protein GUJ93_ZPchr0006g43599 [Zizania palustris]